MNDMRSVRIMIAPQTILIRLENPFFLPDSMKSSMPPRMLVMMERNPMTAMNVIMIANTFSPVLGTPAYATIMMTSDHTMDKSWTIHAIRLMTLANPLCFAASFIRRSAHRIAPIMRTILSICIPIGKTADVVVVVAAAVVAAVVVASGMEKIL